MADPVLCEHVLTSMRQIGGPIKVGKIIDLKGVLDLEQIEVEGGETVKVSNTQFKKAVGSLIDRKAIGRVRATSHDSRAVTTSVLLQVVSPEV